MCASHVNWPHCASSEDHLHDLHLHSLHPQKRQHRQPGVCTQPVDISPALEAIRCIRLFSSPAHAIPTPRTARLSPRTPARKPLNSTRRAFPTAGSPGFEPRHSTKPTTPRLCNAAKRNILQGTEAFKKGVRIYCGKKKSKAAKKNGTWGQTRGQTHLITTRSKVLRALYATGALCF